MAELKLKESSAPSTPASGYVTFYAKTDGKVYFKDDAGNEYSLSSDVAVLKTLADAKGDMFVATAADTVARKAAPADGYTRVAQASQSDGWVDVPYAGNKNAIIGGDFSTNPWQRGTSFAAVANGQYTADRFAVLRNISTGVSTFARTADAPTAAQAGRLTNHCLHIDVTTAETISASVYYAVRQKIEGYNFLPLAQRAFTLSFWHKHTKTGTYCVAFRNSAADRSYIAEYTQDASDTWEKATITVTASPAAGTWDYTTGVGLDVVFVCYAGSTYQTTANAWQTGDYLATANQVNAFDNVNNNMKFALVQLEAGSVATEFETRSVQQELALCWRYFRRKTGDGSAYVSQGVIQNGAASSLYFEQGQMRSTPTVSVAAGTMYAADHNGGLVAVTSYNAARRWETDFSWGVNHAALSTGGKVSSFLPSSGLYVEFSAEL